MLQIILLQRIVCHTVISYCALYAVQKIETEFLSRKIAHYDPPHGSSWFAISAEFDELIYNNGFYQMQLLLMLLHYEHVLSLSTYIISVEHIINVEHIIRVERIISVEQIISVEF